MDEFVIPVEVIELEEENYHLLVKSELPDGSVGNWVIDTGASRSVFDSSLSGFYDKAKSRHDDELFSVGLDDNPFEVETGEIISVRFGDFIVRKFNVALLGFDHINKQYEKYCSEKICGLIGGDFLWKYKALIDYKKKEMRLFKQFVILPARYKKASCCRLLSRGIKTQPLRPIVYNQKCLPMKGHSIQETYNQG